MKICTLMEEVKSWISQRLLHEFLGFVPTIILRMHANSLGLIHIASRAEPSWTWPDRAEPGRVSDYSHCRLSQPELKAVQVTFLKCEDVKPSACFFINGQYLVENISSRHENLGEFHNLLDDLLKAEERFWRYFRMSSDTFKYTLELIHTSFKKQNTHFRRSISPEERLMVTLR